ncbi:MAG: sulfite exporter TauE/SafE family protein [Fulvivirga sp.]
MTYFLLALAGIIAFTISTIAGGGGALLLLPIVGFLLGAQVAAPLVSIGAMVGRPVRLALFWKSIDWNVVKYYLPTALLGALLGSWLFAQMKAEWLQVILGLFLISTFFQFRFGKKKRSFKMKLSYFIPLGFAVSFISGLTGATGPVLTPFYINYGLLKEKMIGTKTANSFFADIVKIGGYGAFGVLSGNLWLYGIALGLGVTVGNIIGKRLLKGMKNETFLKWVILLMVISGGVMIFNQLQSFL